MKYCPNCHTPADDSAKKCARCGYEFPHAPYTRQDSAQTAVKCPRCGNIVSRNAVQCPQCYYVFSSNRGAGLTSVDLIRPGLPVVKEDDDKYNRSPIEEVFYAVTHGDAAAIFELASRYHLGEDGVENDPVKAIGLYKEVLKYQNHMSAFYHIGYLLTGGTCGEDKRKEGLPYLDAAFRLGDGTAAIQLGILYEYGELFPQDDEKALEYFYAALPLGSNDAWYHIGEIYNRQGKDVKAKECYEKALPYENWAAIGLGELYEFGGEGIPMDLNKALSYYQTAYQKRENCTPDSAEAYCLGRFLFFHKKGAEDDRKAFELLQDDASRGNVRANLYLGYYYGVGIKDFLPVDCNKAFFYLGNVLDSQKADALYYQGVIYYDTLHDVDAAKNVLASAVTEGSEDAKNMLADITANGSSGPHLSREEKAEALKRAAESCTSPDAMIDYSQHLLDSGDLFGALDIMKKAYAHFPDNPRVVLCYLLALEMTVHCSVKVGGMNAGLLNDCHEELRLIAILKEKGYKPESVRLPEDNTCYRLGVYYTNEGNDGMALNMLSRTNFEQHPYAAVLTGMIHVTTPNVYTNALYYDAVNLKKALESKNWENNIHKASAYYVLSLIYNTGAPGVPKNLTFAYYYIRECGKLDPEMARDEIKKYSKNLLGTIKYTP